MRSGFKFLVCPDCGKRGVYFTMRCNGEDMYRCRYSACEFYYFTQGEMDAVDALNRDRLQSANKGVSL